MPKVEVTRYFYWAVAIIIVVFAADQVTKHLVLQADVFNAIGCLPDNRMCGQVSLQPVMNLTMLWNRGFSFGLAQSEGIGRWVLFALQIGITGFFFVWLMSARAASTALALALVIGGALGNAIDRFRFGAVVDFFDFSGPYFGIEIPLPGFLDGLERVFDRIPDGALGIGFPYIFNVADAAITIGAVLLIIDQFFLNRHDTETGN